MRKAFFFLVLALFSQVLVAFAQPEIMQTPVTNTGNIMRMQGARANTIRPELFLKDINTTRKAQVYNSMPGTLGYGMINLTTFWLDVPKDMVQMSEENDVVTGSIYGFGKGVVEGLTRGAAGAVDVATLGLLPKKEPLVEPEYTLANPNQGFKVNILEW